MPTCSVQLTFHDPETLSTTQCYHLQVNSKICVFENTEVVFWNKICPPEGSQKGVLPQRSLGQPRHRATPGYTGLCLWPLILYCFCIFFSSNFVFWCGPKATAASQERKTLFFFTPNIMHSPIWRVGLERFSTRSLYFHLSWYSSGRLTPENLILPLSLSHYRLLDYSR